MQDDFVGLMKCYACGKDAHIVIHKKLQSVAHLHGKTAPGVFCASCSSLLQDGNTILISARKRTSETEEPYRTGNMCVLTPQGARRLFKDHGKIPPMAFIEDDLWEQLGLPKADEDHTDPLTAESGQPTAVCNVCGTRRPVNTTWRETPDKKTIKAWCMTCKQANAEVGMTEHALDLDTSYVKPNEEDVVSEGSSGANTNSASLPDSTESVSANVDSNPDHGPRGHGDGLVESSEQGDQHSVSEGSGSDRLESSSGGDRDPAAVDGDRGS